MRPASHSLYLISMSIQSQYELSYHINSDESLNYIYII